MDETHFELEAQDKGDIDSSSHRVEIIVLETPVDDVEPDQTEDDGVEDSIQDPCFHSL